MLPQIMPADKRAPIVRSHMVSCDGWMSDPDAVLVVWNSVCNKVRKVKVSGSNGSKSGFYSIADWESFNQYKLFILYM